MADETQTETTPAAAPEPDSLDWLGGTPAPDAPETPEPKPNGDAKPETEPAKPGLEIGSLLEKLGVKAPAAQPETDRIAALEARIAELTAKPAATAAGGDVRQAMIAAAMAKDPVLDEETAGADADVLLAMFQAAQPQIQPTLSQGDRQLLDAVLQYAQHATQQTADAQLVKEFGEEWSDLKGALSQLHKAMGEPEWMESVPVLTLLGHGLRAMSGTAQASAAAAGEREAIRKGRRQAETTRGADVGGGKDTTDKLFEFLADPNLPTRA